MTKGDLFGLDANATASGGARAAAAALTWYYSYFTARAETD